MIIFFEDGIFLFLFLLSEQSLSFTMIESIKR